uniref:C2 domain-containing protein n=1 Tax=Oryza rufipogon TaxID=4529 RepID=A0A0E0NER2_ORYRU
MERDNETYRSPTHVVYATLFGEVPICLGLRTYIVHTTLVSKITLHSLQGFSPCHFHELHPSRILQVSEEPDYYDYVINCFKNADMGTGASRFSPRHLGLDPVHDGAPEGSRRQRIRARGGVVVALERAAPPPPPPPPRRARPVLYLLRKYLGEYVEGLSVETLRISVWQGDVVLKDLKLKADALNSLRLPVTVKAGFVGTITLKVPWKSLGKEPVIVLIDRLFVLAHPAPDGQTLKEEDREKLFEAKLQQIEAAEAATLEATSRSSKGGPVPGSNSWLYNLISTIIGNLKVTISNVHIRYEDSVSNSGHPFASGFTLSRLAAVTVDEDGNETFDAGVALDKLRKSVELHRLAIYHDSDSSAWKLAKKWEDLNPTEWGEIFQDGIDDHSGNSVWAMNRNYLVYPINGTLNYKRLGKQERGGPDIPLEKASLVLSDVSLTVTEAQYYDGIKLLETFSRFRTRVDVSHLRPIVPVKVDCRAWWRYAVLAAIGSHGRELGISASFVDAMLLGHAKVETVKSKEILHKKGASKRRWWTFGWNSAELPSEENALLEPQLDEEERLTKEEWQAINKLLSYQPEDDLSSPLEKVSPNTTRFLVDVSIGQAAARIINIDRTEILCGRFEKLQVVTKLYPKSTRCDVTLRYCGLSSPEGSLAQSVVSEGKSNALDVSFVRAPVGLDLDWQLVAKISPCHVTVLKGSYERFLEFIKRSKAVSPTMKIEQVTRRAQEQLQMVLEEQSSFGLDIDLDAPKDGTREEERRSLYSRFYIAGRDMAAFVVCDTAEDIYSVPENQRVLSGPTVDANQFCSLLDRCGMSVIIDQIKVPHPSYPSTRVSFQVPNLDIHFSPKRYGKIVELLGVLCKLKGSDSEDSDSCENCNLAPWYPADLAGDARTLVWKGLGYSLAEWHTSYVVLSGMYLYILESEVSQDYQSMASRQVIEVPSTSVGGSLYSIAVCSRGVDMQKALESTSTLIIEYHNEIEKANWMKALVQATYQASAPPEVNILGDPVSTTEPSTPRLSSLGSVDLLVNGSVVETKLSLYAKLDRKKKDPEEVVMLELLGSGGKVNVVQSSRGLSVKTKLHSLKIKDELQGRLSMSSNYLACSVINDNLETVDSSSPDEEDHRKSFSVEEDSFMDALTDFTPDQSPNLQDLEIPSNSIFDPDGHTQLSSKDGLSFDGDQQKVKPTEVFYEAQDNNINDFVVLTFLTRTPDSCLYDGIDSQMCIRMSALEFYCNRPTLVALIEFGFDLSMVNSAPKGDSDTTPAVRNVKPTGTEDNARNFVKGLLGYGKRRTIFNMKMDVDRVSMFLNKEDGSQLAMFVQEKFLFDLKVHPGSFSIDGMLGNMRFCDMSLGPEHRWGWLCDIRKPGVESLIKFAFQSYSVDDDDYEGYNYSLIGQLSAVRIVFLYRFVQEFTSYFMELATPHTEEAIKFIDKVGGFEWLIQKYEIDGASAIKLDLSLDTPIIIVPKNSQSKDYIQLDLGQLKVRNGFCWRGGEESDPSAVRLDILQAEINGINMAVGVNGILGKSMIREGHGINIEVRRSLRDVFKRVPMLCMKFQIGLLHGIMSDKEYNVITSCISTNLSEAPNLPPGFRDNVNRTKDSIRLLADKVNLNNHLLLSRTVVVMTVDVQYALFELRNGPDAESPLAELVLEGLWVSYRTTSLFEMDLYLSILKFLIHDIRPDTKSEMRLMLGSYSETSKLSTQDPSSDVGVSNLTMVILDYRWRSSFQSFVIRIQEPRVLVVLDFLLPVVEFFVPNLGTITGREESLDPKNDPLIKSDDIILCEPVFFQRENFIQLSPGRQLIVDGCDIDDFTYDGCGGTISLCDEYDKKGQLYSGTIIILGRGKKLRFKNVKIENGALLRRCVYLNAGSSYSISAEDGVEVSVLESSLNDNEDDNTQNEEYKRINALQPGADTPSAQMLNFTFEAQVVSPEFTFYDSSKLSIDDSLHIEKLLRAKMDFSFMYASKEKDIWARSVVKDLTIEAGSGLLVLEPVDVSWKYTSVSEKTNIVLASTDVYIHLSLSVASLLLKLQNQTLAALQFGNNNPLVSCINFKRVWTSPNGELPGYNLTFWRPQAPSNYVILGDCVSSRCVPPSQVVVAVSNTYGRVRKPLGFRLVHVLPVSLEQMNSSQAAEDNECSIWIPVPPPGYIALGVTPGFSIWRVDNVIASFHAHNSIEQPTRVEALDLHHVLLRNPNCYIVKDLNADSSVRSNQPADQLTHRKSTSGWDAVRNLSRPSSYCMSTPHFERIWWDKGGDTKRPFSIWRPIPRFGFSSVGDCITEGFEPPTLGILFKCDSAIVSERPTQFKKVAQIDRKGSDEILFFWYPVPPPGYASLGCVATKTDEMPSNDSVCCPKMGLVNHANILEDPISRSSSSKGPNCWSIWKVSNQGCTFLATSDTKKPPAQMAYRIADHAKPKVRENITAELKFGCLSVSILDSSCGMVTPIFDTTIANINLATHGKFETMNAVLICSISASTFNRHLEAWEPFVEPFDGIFKFETYDTSKHPPSKVGKRIRVAATSPLNVNLSSANLDLLIETLISWKRQIDLEKKSSIKNEDTVDSVKNADDLSCSALDEDDFQRIVFENKLGCDIYVKKLEDNEDIIELLQHENQVSLFMPPPRFSDKLSVLSNSTESRYYVIIQIFESKGLPIMDDGNDHSYFCALRLLVGSDVSDQYKVFPQSARTRCVKPLKTCESQTHHAKWNEHFIFEVPEQASAHLEIEVTNLASKAGKGEVLGSLSIPIGRGATILKRAASMRIIQQAADVKRVLTCPLTRKGQALNHENVKHCGMLVLSSCYVERSTQTNFQSWKDSLSNAKSGFWIGLGPDGPWECFTAALPLSTIPKSLNNSHFALEVTMRNGKKHASLRALAIIANGFDIKLEVSVCPVTMHSSSVSNAGSTSSTSIIDEVFENQWYRPTSGWGSNPASDQGCDVGPWSTKDGSYSSKAFFEPRLPPGWKWTSPWKIEISSSVDSDGWAYAANFQNLNWPSSWKSSKSPHDFVRRRRWVRSRQSMQEQSAEIPRKIIAVMEPHASTALPWTAMIKDMDLCLQVRPFSEKSQESYSWSQVLSLGSESIPKQQQSSLSRQSTLKQSSVPSKNSVLRLADLEKKDMLSYCCPPVGIKQNFWLSVGIDASILHTDLNMPIYDWKICFNSILRLENKLPYEAEYAIWEKSTEGSMVERQHGIVSSGGSAFIYSADIRKPIYLTMFVQNGWIIEKDTVLILDLMSLEHVTSFWMVQNRSQRRLRVSVEHDLGASDAAPKTLRLFVPYWIKNISSIPLSYRIVEIFFKISYQKRPSGTEKYAHIGDYVMLSPQDYMNRSAGVRFESRDNNSSPARVAICVAVGSCKQYSIGVSLFDLENKEHVDVKAFTSDGSYYWFSAQLKMTSDRTKVINFLPRALFINRIGRSIILSEYHSETEEHLHPSSPPQAFQWRSEFGNELLKLRLEGYKWSTPFSIDANGVMCVLMNNTTGNDQALVRVNVRSGTKCSRYEVVFQLACWSSPYRVENRSMFLPVRFRQVGGDDYSWRSLPPNSSASFFWEDIGRRRLLEVLVDGSDPTTSMTYDIDVVMDHQPLAASSRVKKALRVTVLKEGKFHVTQINDWLPDNRTREQTTERLLSPIFQPSEVDSGQSSPDLDSEFHVTLELTEFGLSIIDHMPEEILFLSVQQLLLAYSSGMGSGINRLKMQMHWIQVDNQLPFVLMPVLFCPQRMENQSDYIIKFSMTLQTNNSLEFCVYPYLGVQPIIWRLHEMIQNLKFDRISSSESSAVSVDPILKIGLLNISEIRFRVSMAMSPTQRPRGVLGFWSSLMTALGNMEHMPVRIAQRYREELCMRQSALMSSAMSNIQKDILSQPLQLLSGVDILGNASSALSNMSKGIAALSMDKKFIQGRMRQDSKGVEDFGDVIRDGGGALAKGIFRGVTGILTKPIEGAKSSGVEGFVQGVGKGLIGAAAQPVSGVLDLLSKTTEGANAVKMKISSAIMAEEQLARRRLPRAIGGDSLLYPYDDHKAAGQAILQLAEYATFLGQVDLFKVRGKFASTDAYEDHFMLPKGKILLITHRRVLLLQVPMMTQRKFSPAKDPCSVIWDVLWDDLVTVEMTHGKKDAPGSLPSKLILYLKAKPTNSREVVRLVKCNRGSDQATLIYSSIDGAYKAYGPKSTKELLRWKVPRPYAPRNTSGRTVQDLSYEREGTYQCIAYITF